MTFEEAKEYALSDFERKNKELEDWLMKPVSEYKGKGFLEQIKEGDVWPERSMLFYYLCEAIQIRYRDAEIEKYVDPKIMAEKRELKRKLLDFVHHLEKSETELQAPKWMRAFSCLSTNGEPVKEDTYAVNGHFLIKVPAGSTVAQCLLLSELDFLPKEEGL